MDWCFLSSLKTSLKIFRLCFFLYVFLFSIALMGSSFKLLGHGFAEQMIHSVSNPFTALLIGILVTSIIQSSSATSSIVVGLVGGLGIAGIQDSAGHPETILTIQNAIPIIMGANIGTSITNLIVSLGHISHRAEFRRAFSAAIIHDTFNLMVVAIFLPIQIATNFLGIIASKTAFLFSSIGGLKFASPIKAITKPLVKLVIDSPAGIGWLLIIISLGLLFLALTQLVRTLKSLVLTKVEVFFDTYMFKTPLRAFSLGLILTAVVQSSSITTSLIVPLAGSGILTLYQVFPYTLGANLGTTVTALLASLAIGRPEAVTIALAHIYFNFLGMIFVWPIRRIPINFVRWFAILSVKRRILPIIFIALVFFIIPIILLIITE